MEERERYEERERETEGRESGGRRKKGERWSKREREKDGVIKTSQILPDLFGVSHLQVPW